MNELDKESDAITPLESSQRERDFENLLDWYHEYDDWLRTVKGDFEDDLELVSTGIQEEGWWQDRYDAMAQKQDALAGELQKMVESFDIEGKRLAAIIEHRRALQERFIDLKDRLARVEEEMPAAAPERRDGDRKAENLRAEIRVVKDELLSLPLVDEDLLRHYAVLVERGEGEMEWLSLQRDQYEWMRGLAAVAGRSPRHDAPAIETSYRQTVRLLEGEINWLSRKKDEMDRKRSRVTPAGSLKEVARSRELANFYERLQGRYDNEIRSLRVLVGSCNADLAEVLSEK